VRHAATLLLGLTLLVGCGDDPAGTGDSQDLATLKALTAPYQSFDAGKSAGWTAPFMNACFASDSGRWASTTATAPSTWPPRRA
jgi:hypothetical protein